MNQEILLPLLQLLEDYTSQTLDAARDVSNEFEEELEELLNRAKRIHTVLRLIQECEAVCYLHLQLKHKFIEEEEEEDLLRTPVQIALWGLGEIVSKLTGVPSVDNSEKTITRLMIEKTNNNNNNNNKNKETLQDISLYGLQQIGKPVSLAEAALELFSHNTRVVFRRSEKRTREVVNNNNKSISEKEKGKVEMEKTKPTTIFSHLAASQRKKRFALYTARKCLFPQAIPTPISTIIKNNEEISLINQTPTTPFISPAIKEFATLNVEAECEMLAAFYKVNTRAQLLRELPSLRNSIEHLQQSLRTAGVKLESEYNIIRNLEKEEKEKQQDEEKEKEEKYINSTPWFEFPYTSEGVIRIIIRRSLVLDITWDSARGGPWCVLNLHWLLHVQTLPEIIPNSFYNNNINNNNNNNNNNTNNNSAIPGNSLRVHVAHREATMRYLSNYFETGLESGCLAALRIVNAVVMEIIEIQCRILRETFFIGPLENFLTIDIRPGTHVALTLQLPASSNNNNNVGVSVSEVWHLKYKLYMGTVVVERRCGTDTSKIIQSDIYLNILKYFNTFPMAIAVVDVESMIWKLLSSDS